MTINDFKDSISTVLNGKGISAEFFFLLNASGEIEIKRADIDKPSQDELSAQLIDYLKSAVILNEGLSLVDISKADDRKNTIFKYDLQEVPSQLISLKKIIDKDDFGNFKFGADKLSDLEGILILIGNQDYQLALYKHQYPITLLKRDSGFNLITMWNQNRFKKLDEDILKINAKFEFIFLNDEYYILDLNVLEKFLGFHEAIKNVALEGINKIISSGLIEDANILSNRLDDITFARKLAKATKDSLVLGVIPNQDIIQFTSSYPALKGKIKVNFDGTKLDLKTKQSQNLFIKLLNDDFLQSELTKHFYESLAKENILSAE